jgi:D-alanyl-D-alanine dipeptidase
MHRLAPLALAAVACGRSPGTPPGPPDDARGIASATDAGAIGRDAAVTGARTAVPAGWADVAALIPDAVLDLRYAAANNLTGAPLYPVARCLLRPAVAARLADAAERLRAAGHRLLLWDCYRPASMQRELWRRVPDRRYVAEPRFDDAGRPVSGSRHSRGAAIDLALADADGAPRPLPTDHDTFGPAASGTGATGPAAAMLADLRAAMTAAGFAPLASEWWHFDAPDALAYPLADDPLE